MLLAPIVEGLADDLKRAAAVGGDDIRSAADMLVEALGPALRMRLLDALQQAGDELAASFPGASVELHLQGRDPVLTMSIGHGPSSDLSSSEGSDAEMARLTLRLPEGLKSQVERAANRDGLSINSWLVEAAAQALRLPPTRGRSSSV